MIVERLAALVGHRLSDQSDEHARWAVYQVASERADAYPTLLAAVAEEPDRNVALSVVLAVLERLPADEHEAWVGALAEDNREHAEQRSAEVRLLRRAGELGAEEVAAELPEWTNWLQLRIADGLTAEARAVVAERGRTRRIRNAAATYQL
jgi:hypothetical protein